MCVTAQANDLEATLVHRNPRETLRASAKPRNIQIKLVTVAVIEGKVLPRTGHEGPDGE